MSCMCGLGISLPREDRITLNTQLALDDWGFLGSDNRYHQNPEILYSQPVRSRRLLHFLQQQKSIGLRIRI